jgi:anti-sigma factor RsiW
MTLTDEILLQYVDGLLPASEVAQIEAALSADHLAAERVRLMRRSGVTLAAERMAPAAAVDDRILQRMLGRKSEPVRRDDQSLTRSRQGGFRNAALAASVALLIGTGAGWLARDGLAPQSRSLPVWVGRVVDYHSLYARETMDGQAPAPADVDAMKRRFSTLIGRPVTIPGFGPELEFRRGQILQFAGEPIIQLAYLPAKGLPLALCFKRVDEADLAPAYRRVSGIGMVRWRRDGTEYVLVGEQPEAVLRSVAHQSIVQVSPGRAP